MVKCRRWTCLKMNNLRWGQCLFGEVNEARRAVDKLLEPADIVRESSRAWPGVRLGDPFSPPASPALLSPRHVTRKHPLHQLHWNGGAHQGGENGFQLLQQHSLTCYLCALYQWFPHGLSSRASQPEGKKSWNCTRHTLCIYKVCIHFIVLYLIICLYVIYFIH